MEDIIVGLKLNYGHEIPEIGYGTFRSPVGEVTENAVLDAILAGYKHIDTAAAYGNEPDVGNAIVKSGINREELFVTTKAWTTYRGYENTKKAMKESLQRLKLDYLDLYLMHWPTPKNKFENWEEYNAETWRAMEDLQKEGYAISIGVSNFTPDYLEALLKTAKVIPAVNQVEFHPGANRDDVVKASIDRGILIEAWSPLGAGNLLKNDTINEIAAKREISPAQVCIAWCIRHGVIALPKSVTKDRIISNLAAKDIKLCLEDIQLLDSLEDTWSGLTTETFPYHNVSLD